MIGAIIGDIVGSRFEHFNIKTKEFNLFDDWCACTDDSVMSLAVCEALLTSGEGFENLGERAVECMQDYGRTYPHAGYGKKFSAWIGEENPQPYGSWGNGSAMRVSGCGYAASSLEEAKALSLAVTEVSHNHPEGIKGAEAVAVAVYLAKSGSTKEEIREYVNENYYKIDFTLDEIRENYSFDVSCQGSVPQALEAFFESEDFEDAVRSAISIGGDSDTIAAIAGSVAGAYYGVPENLRKGAARFMDQKLTASLTAFEEKYSMKN